MTNGASPGRTLRRWMRVVGAFYLIQAAMMVLVRAPIRTFGPEGTLARAGAGDPVATFLVDTWTTFGFEVAAVGVALLVAARRRDLALGAIWTVLAIEVGRGILLDTFMIARGVNVSGYLVWIVIHSVVNRERGAGAAGRSGEPRRAVRTEQQDAYYLALVRFLGCTSFAHEAAHYGAGDDIRLNSVMSFVDPGQPLQLVADVVRGVGFKGMAALIGDRSAPLRHARAECDVGDALARLMGIPAPIVVALADLFERWDGNGYPGGKEGEESALLARVVVVADVLEIAFSRYGLDAATETARKRSGGRFDPSVVATFCAHAPELVAGLGGPSAWELYLDTEPQPHCQVTPALVARYAEAFARAVDLKSVWTATHSHSVGLLAARRARRQGSTPPPSSSCASPAGCTISGGWPCPMPSGTSPAP